MKVLSSQILIAGSPASIDILRKDSMQSTPGFSKNGFHSRLGNAYDDDPNVISVTHIGGASAHVRFGEESASLDPGETALFNVYSSYSKHPNFEYRSMGAVSVLAVAMGRSAGSAAEELAAVAQAMASVKG